MLTSRFETALVWTHQLHANQVRKGANVPYVCHLLSVAALVIEAGGDEDEAIAGLLHDAIEDQGGLETRAEIARRYGERVAEIVSGCSDSHRLPKPAWRPRKEAYIARLANSTESVLLVSAADKLHNSRSLLSTYKRIGEALWNRFSGGRETLWYYRALVDAYVKTNPAGGRAWLVEEISEVVSDLERLAGRP